MENKLCTKCNEEKEVNQFHASKKRGYQAWCKPCRKKADKEYWSKRSKDSEKMNVKKQYNITRLENMRKFLYQYFLEHPCVDCGEKDPVVLTFDHISDKNFTISNRIKYGNIKEIEKEIKKCQVRCSNCHMRKTAKDFNWYTYRYSLANIIE
jgi:hypothetical protein